VAELFDLTGRVALVVGTGGLGRAMALALAGAGADIAAVDGEPGRSEQVAEEVRGRGRRAVAMCLDINDRQNVYSLVRETVSTFGKIDVLLNSAGINVMAPALEATPEQWHQVIDHFLTSVFWCCQAAGKEMVRARKGSIINVASMSGLVVTGNQGSSYCAAKAGVIQLSRALATEWAPYGVRVNSISPGVMRTRLTEHFLSDPAGLKDTLARIPLGRVGEPEDLMGTAVFLASDASSYITGHNLVVDGGYTAW